MCTAVSRRLTKPLPQTTPYAQVVIYNLHDYCILSCQYDKLFVYLGCVWGAFIMSFIVTTTVPMFL